MGIVMKLGIQCGTVYICVVGIANGPVGMVFFYEKEVQDKVVELGLTTINLIFERG